MIAAVEDKRAEVAALCERYGVQRLDLFGRYFGLEEALEALFGREVDLIMEGALSRSRRFAANVEASRVPLYGA